ERTLGVSGRKARTGRIAGGMSAPGTARGVGHRDYGAGAVPVRPLRVFGEDSRAAFLPMLDQGRAATTLGLRRPAVGAAGGVDQGVHATRRRGAFYLKPNWPGRARHVANAGFMVAPQWRNRGLGWLLGAMMLQYAKELGYRSVIFNLVFAENQVARRLWRKLGFSELAVL